MIEYILRRAGFLEPDDNIVRIKSRWPYWDGSYVCWPVLLVDNGRGGRRRTASPCWRWLDVKVAIKGS